MLASFLPGNLPDPDGQSPGLLPVRSCAIFCLNNISARLWRSRVGQAQGPAPTICTENGEVIF
ncbi:MAG: hypothetical protein D3904_09140 [Candidatus Electrothrix sp. EH2]|nr:hypothetical protein [Candidatus Electrothrix sp. EH2]